MTYNSEIHHRRSIRLKGYDYSSAGAYFITICTHNHQCLFGEFEEANGCCHLSESGIILSDLGLVVYQEWLRTPVVRPQVQLDIFVVMPNHFHAIFRIIPVGAYSHTPLPAHMSLQSPSRSIGAIVRGFKSAATKRINEIRCTPANPVWQRNYYEHVIRNQESYYQIRQYIHNNPRTWANDQLNPQRCVSGENGNPVK